MSRDLFFNQVSRRRFVQSTGALAAMVASGQAPVVRGANAPSQTVRIAVMGLNRGMAHVQAFLQVPQVQIAAVCDVDELRVAAAIKAVRDKTGQEPKGAKDFRRLLEDPSIDAISIAAPNFWHAPATILACSAGKHVYVEKPGSHNAHEGELMVEAARKHHRHVQMGNQRRSMPIFVQAIQELRGGVIGTLRFSRCWYDSARGTIGKGKTAPIPATLDYSLWQGPAPERPYVDNLVHYNWHWRWHWGGGELANNGIHTLDLARWGLGVEFPQRVTCQGGRYHFQDDQETPDTILATYDFGHCGITWDGSSCHPRTEEHHPLLTFYGDGGSLSLNGNQYTLWDTTGKKIRTESGSASDVHHFANFVDAIRDGARLNSEIAVGQKSTLLCHLGNIAWRTQSTLSTDPATGRLQKPTREQTALWTREYRAGWKPKV